ncbi:MAG TPA: response regulator, partial [Chloroflexota bacterium]
AGYSVKVASTGTQALAGCRNEVYDAITLDILLPDMSGWDVLRGIRADSLNRQTPVVVATVMTDDGIGRALAIHDYLVKPIHGDELLASLERAGANPAAATGPVLVVDDDPIDRQVAERYLTAEGYRLVLAPDGESALREALRDRPAAVVLDLVMPGMDGFTFLGKFRRTRAGRQTPVIVWTAADLTKEQRSRLDSAAQAVLVKGDIRTSTLLEEIARQLPVRNPVAYRSPGTAEVQSEPTLPA